MNGSTRAQRFLILRDAILANPHRIRQVSPLHCELICGPFLISWHLPGSIPGRYFNMNIWPGREQGWGHMMHGHKVANVDWDQFDNVDILSYRSGPWEGELLSLLTEQNNVAFFG